MEPQRFFATGETPLAIAGTAYNRTYVSVRLLPRADGGVNAEVFVLMADGPRLRAGQHLKDVHALTTNGAFILPDLRIVSAERTDLGLTFDAVNHGPCFEWDLDGRVAKLCGS